MMEKPQYCYVVAVFICTKIHDLTYPACDDYLRLAQSASEILKESKPSHTRFFQSALLGFLEFEHDILQAVDCQVTFCSEPNGDQYLSAGVLYYRFASAHGLTSEH